MHFPQDLNITAANFWTDTLAGVGGIISSDNKASVMIKQDGSTITIGVCDPTRENTGKIRLSIKKGIKSILEKDARVDIMSCNSDGLVIDVNVKDAAGQTIALTTSTTEGKVAGLPIAYDFEAGQWQGNLTFDSQSSYAEVTTIPGTETKGLKIESKSGSGIKNYDFEGTTPLADFGLNGKKALNISTSFAYTGTQSVVFDQTYGSSAGAITLTPDNYIIEVWMYDPGPGKSATAILQTAQGSTVVNFGLYGAANPNFYVFRTGASWNPTTVPRSAGWHKLTADFSSGTDAKFYFENTLLGTVANMTKCDFVALADYWNNGNNASAYMDDLKIMSPQGVLPTTKATYDMPFITAIGQFTIESDVYTDYSGDAAIYPFECFESTDKKILSVGFKNNNIVLRTKEGEQVLAVKAVGKNTFKTNIDTATKTFDLYANGVLVLQNHAFYDDASFFGGVCSSIENAEATVYIDNVKVSQYITPYSVSIQGSLNAVGTVTATINPNKAYEDDYVVIGGLYKGDKLVEGKILTKAELDNLGTIKFNISEASSEYYIKFFAWNNIGSIKPLSGVVMFK